MFRRDISHRSWSLPQSECLKGRGTHAESRTTDPMGQAKLWETDTEARSRVVPGRDPFTFKLFSSRIICSRSRSILSLLDPSRLTTSSPSMVGKEISKSYFWLSSSCLLTRLRPPVAFWMQLTLTPRPSHSSSDILSQAEKRHSLFRS